MNVADAQPFFDAAKGVFSQMFGLASTMEKPRLLDGGEDHEWEISGILGIAGSAHGIIALRFPLTLADALLKASGVETTSEQDRLATASGLVAEITNIIAGNATVSYPKLNLEISPPVVVKGKNHQISWPKIAPVVGARFSSSVGAFEVGVCFTGSL